MKIRVTGEKPADSINVTGGRPSAVIEVAAGLVSSVNGKTGGVTGLAQAADLIAHQTRTTGVHGITDTSALLTEVPFDDTSIRDITQNSLPGASTAAARADHTHGGAGGGGGLTGIYDVTKAPYNAAGNGVADDLAAIEAALQAAYTAGGGTVYLPPGRTYGISDHLHILTGVTVVAYGATVKGIANRGLAKLYQETDTAFTGYNGHSRIRIYGGIWDVNASDGTTGTATSIVNGFLLGHNNDVIFRDVTVRNVSSGHGIDLPACQNIRILNCRFEGFRDNTADQSSSFREAIQLDFAVSGSGINGAFDGTGCRNILVHGCSFGASSRLGGFGRAVGSHSSNNATTWCDGVQIFGNRIEATLQEGVRVYAWRNAVVADNIISGTGLSGIMVTGPDPAVAGYVNLCQNISVDNNTIAAPGSASGSPIRVSGFATARPTGVTISRNTVTGSLSTGIYVSQADTPQINTNRVLACPSSSIYAINSTAPHIATNHVSGAGGVSIGVETCTGGQVAVNDVENAGSHGILVTGGSDVMVNGNRVNAANNSGIRATSSTARARIMGNTIIRGGTTDIGLDVTASATDCVIIGNDLTGGGWTAAGAAAFNLVGTRQMTDWTPRSGVPTDQASGFNLAN